jgi:predicted dehydrogenase
MVAGGFFVSPNSVFAFENNIKIAVLGTGWWGTDVLLASMLKTTQFEIIGLCDVNAAALQNAAGLVEKAGRKKPALFSSYEEMYAMPGLEAVVIATPTHWHPLQFIAACNKGLHVFLEKPISYDIREGQAMLKAQQKAGNVVQVDFPRVMTDSNQKVKTILESGALGKIFQVQANIHNEEGGLVEKPIPANFDFETFCGPAPRKKFLCNENGVKPDWRAQHDFSRGVLADWGIHYIHNVRRILQLGIPASVSAIGGTVRNFTQDNPDQLDVRFDFDGLPVYWSHKAWGYKAPDPDRNIGVYYYGDKATLFAGDLGWELYAADGKKQTTGDIRFNPGGPGVSVLYDKMIADLFMEFAAGIRKHSNAGITNTLEEAQKTTSTVIFGDMAYRTKSNLVIDPKTMDIKDNPAAQALLTRAYRKPYIHP